MTVQEIIDELLKVQDKTKKVHLHESQDTDDEAKEVVEFDEFVRIDNWK